MAGVEAVRKIAYRPRWSGDHVEGTYTERTRSPSGFEDQIVEARCAKCGAVYGPVKCSSGLVRDKIDKFAHVHRHEPVFPKR